MNKKNQESKIDSKNLERTGERMVTSDNSYGSVEHLHRYSIAMSLLKETMVVLDVASGEGYGTYMIAQTAKTVVGLDISEEAIKNAKLKYQRKNLSFIRAGATEIPLGNNLFDIIISFETLEHLAEHDLLIKELKRLLKTDGMLIISTPDKRFYGKNSPNPFHVKELDFPEFKILLDKYFSHTKFMFQKTIHGSLIFNNDSPEIIQEYNGDFNNITSFKTITEPEFLLGFASDSKIIDFNVTNSLFDASRAHNSELENLKYFENKYFGLICSKKFGLLNKLLKKLGLGFNI